MVAETILLNGLYQRFDFLGSIGGVEDWLLACDRRGNQISTYDDKLSQLYDVETQMIMWQANDASWASGTSFLLYAEQRLRLN